MLKDPATQPFLRATCGFKTNLTDLTQPSRFRIKDLHSEMQKKLGIQYEVRNLILNTVTIEIINRFSLSYIRVKIKVHEIKLYRVSQKYVYKLRVRVTG